MLTLDEAIALLKLPSPPAQTFIVHGNRWLYVSRHNDRRVFVQSAETSTAAMRYGEADLRGELGFRPVAIIDREHGKVHRAEIHVAWVEECS